MASPSQREQHVMAYEGNSQRILLFGGYADGDTWLYGPVALVRLPMVMK